MKPANRSQAALTGASGARRRCDFGWSRGAVDPQGAAGGAGGCSHPGQAQETAGSSGADVLLLT
eukprot:15453949-Alexandrium_andersonii.AAC.1